MKASSWSPVAVVSLGIVFGACTNGGKNVRDTTGMTPGSAAGQVGGAAGTTSVAPGAATSAPPAATADSSTSRRDTLGGRMARMRPGMSPMMRGMPGDSAHRMMRDSARRRP